MSLDFSLNGKVAIVTGGGKGIGRGIAVAYARCGADVVVCGRHPETLEDAQRQVQALGRKAVAIPADVGKVADIKRVVAQTLDVFGVIDILVNNAGVNRTGPTLEVTEETWEWILNTNLKGTFFFCQEVGRHMVERRKGKIINIGSIMGDWGLGFNVPYCSSKGGMNLLTKALALEWAPFGIHVNEIGPGYIRTDQVNWSLQDPQLGPRIHAKMPMRVGEVEDVEGAAVFLASDASNYISGRTLYVDGAQAVGWMGPE
ncbi:MAG TPA: glucose 1-dehydrogenase [Anaerolineae bacterium]|nr:glucose 1-dehydrogenase [Anaerolineae bacterium]